MATEKKVWFNDAQIEFVTAKQKIRCWIGGRGSGKSSVVAWILREMMQSLPGGRIYYAATTLEQIKVEILPEVVKKLKEFGFIEGIHYVNCKAPPSHFDEPLAPIKEYGDCFMFFNGFHVLLRSTVKWKSKKGGSFDGGILDEAAETKGNLYKKVFLPAIRGNKYKFDSHWHGASIVLSNRPMPENPASYWINEFKEMQDRNPAKCFFMETSALVNLAVLGDEWFEDQLLQLGEDAYKTSILNEDLRQLPTGFYHRLDRSLHCYTNAPMATDVRADNLLEISFDFGGKFNCCTVWQEHGFVERCLHQFFVKKEGKISTLVEKVCRHYAAHGLKYVRVWGEPRGKDPDPERPDLYQVITQKFSENGWVCEVKVKPGYRTKRHKERYTFGETILSGSNPNMPAIAINEETCPDLLKALEICDVNDDYTKVKTMEKDPTFPQEHAPHFTDTFDYYLYEKHAWRMNATHSRAGGVW